MLRQINIRGPFEDPSLNKWEKLYHIGGNNIKPILHQSGEEMRFIVFKNEYKFEGIFLFVCYSITPTLMRTDFDLWPHFKYKENILFLLESN